MEINYSKKVPVKGKYDVVVVGGGVAGCAGGEGYGWDIIRSIPASIVTGQAAGIACSLSIDSKNPIYGADIKTLQTTLEKCGAALHFDDKLIPEIKEEVFTETGVR